METERIGEWLELVVPNKWDGKTVDRIMRKDLGVPRKLMHRFRNQMGVSLNDEFIHWKNTTVSTGDLMCIRLFEPQPLTVKPNNMPIDVIYEDDHLLVVNKPSGVFTHPNFPTEDDTLVNGVAGYFVKEGILSTPKYVHRLDRHTSGAILFAKHDLAIAMLGKELQKRTIKRTYLAWANGSLSPEKGVISHPIGKDPEHTIRRCVTEDGQYAETHYEVLRYNAEKDASLVKLQLETGRTHQIRVHMSYVGHPLLGDTMYGGQGDLHYKQALHAAKLTFIHPFTEQSIQCFAYPEESESLFTDEHVNALK
ncbi:RluA family pseudouridine synthase [Halobacillus yeomjeoni]|uniref:Pseudouridine synthase n=1 Tax=Halobacillus yeomjeoni TaxID=311194 RepID=A0A931HXA7_9BACI|nr:RluA family pseudouridine synthase [Halobacillus yeomjeoni]MBH0231183.1 RluA family pseudouridine synthase [Halobacillus yeomjeoni]